MTTQSVAGNDSFVGVHNSDLSIAKAHMDAITANAAKIDLTVATVEDQASNAIVFLHSLTPSTRCSRGLRPRRSVSWLRYRS